MLSKLFALMRFQQTGLIFQPYYYRTGAGAEIDLIIECSKGILPIEIKFTQKINRRDLRALKDFISERKLPDRLGRPKWRKN